MKQKLFGRVIKIIDAKTAKVEVESIKSHPIYRKKYKRHQTYLADRGKEKLTLGEKVKLIASRPISKLKKWRIVKIK